MQVAEFFYIKEIKSILKDIFWDGYGLLYIFLG